MAFPILAKFEKGECEQCSKPATRVITKYVQPAWIHIVCDECLNNNMDSMLIGPYISGMMPEQLYR